MFADVHCHLDHDLLQPRLAAIIQAARDARLGLILASGVNPQRADACLAIAKKYPDIVKVSLGIYPLDALGIDVDEQGRTMPMAPIDVDAELARFDKMQDRFVAVGEAGLDFHWVKDQGLFAKQQQNFLKVIAFAERVRKPLIVHSRAAERECVEMLESSTVKDVIMHCFSGRKSLVKRCADHGWYFSIPCNISRAQHFQGIVQAVPLTQLLTETDAPWLSPVPGELNEPKNVAVTVLEIAKLLKQEPAAVEDRLWKNAEALFLKQ
jgi:TatD DNase family protein